MEDQVAVAEYTILVCIAEECSDVLIAVFLVKPDCDEVPRMNMFPPFEVLVRLAVFEVKFGGLA